MRYILSADDELVNQMIIEEMLDDCCEVVSVGDGVQCLQSIEARLPDMLLLDVSMPKMDGFEVCRQLRSNEKTRELPIIMLSGHAHDEQINAGLKAGATQYITKPFSLGELRGAIDTLLPPNRD